MILLLLSLIYNTAKLEIDSSTALTSISTIDSTIDTSFTNEKLPIRILLQPVYEDTSIIGTTPTYISNFTKESQKDSVIIPETHIKAPFYVDIGVYAVLGILALFVVF